MKNSKVLKGILLIAGLMFVAVGVFSTFNPIDFVGRNGFDITGNLVALNDYRGTGGVILGMGTVILLGLIHLRMAFTSTVVAAVAYTLFAVGRTISIVMDGMPVDTLVKATVVEYVVGALAIFALIKFRDTQNS